MAYDEGLAQRIREAVDDQLGLSERKMFGGIGFMLQGNMACGVIGEDLIVRVGPGAYDEALTQEYARPFDFTGREMRGWVVVGSPGYEEDGDLVAWLHRGFDFARSLPPK